MSYLAGRASGDDGKALILGAMARLIGDIVAAFGQLAISHRQLFRGDDLLKMMAVTLEPPDGHQNPADQ